MPHDDTRPHLAVQILAVIALGIVSIVAVSLAFDATWVAGIAVLALLFPLWMKSPAFSNRRPHASEWHRDVAEVAPSVPAIKPTGNASFDAYRSDVLNRLEQEREEFESFLTRLREARDTQEFTRFMDDRAERSQTLHDPAEGDTSKSLSGY